MALPFSSGSDTLIQAATNIDPNPNKGLGAALPTSGGVALLAYAGPSGTVADVPTSATSGQVSVYVVRSGDTLSDIARMFGVSVNTIIWANDLKSRTDVHPGDTLVILPISGVKRTIVKGDTLKSIAKKYDADANEIAQFNGLDPEEPLVIESTIIVPGGEVVPVEIKSVSPVKAPTVSNSTFFAGYYINPVPSGVITQGIHGWNGVDLGAARGTPVYATAEGTVIVARGGGAWNGGYGNYVVIAHENGSQTLYAHLKSVSVAPMQQVLQGQIIGTVGSTGRSTGSHLHFEVRGAANPLRNCALRSTCSAQ